MPKPFGSIRLPVLHAPDVWHARMFPGRYATEPRSTVTVALNAGGLKPGDLAGLALFDSPNAWIGVEHAGSGLALAHFGEQIGRSRPVKFRGRRVWLRVECEFVRGETAFGYSTDGLRYTNVGPPHAMGDRQSVNRGIQCVLFSCNTNARVECGHADFDSFVVTTSRS
jgi:xylan 1,4-beta-xylosidase